MYIIVDDFAFVVQLPFSTKKPCSFYSYLVVTAEVVTTHDLVWSTLAAYMYKCRLYDLFSLALV